MKLPRGEDWDLVADAVGKALAEADERPRRVDWRHRAIGMTRAEAMAIVPRKTRLDLTVPLGEMRMIRAAAQRRGLTVRGYLRRALATIMVCDGFDPDEMPMLSRGGPLVP